MISLTQMIPNLRIFLQTLGALLLWGALAAAQTNVVFVITDDQGYGDLGCTGNPIISTCLLYTSPSPRDATLSRMPSSA